jgi:hypothetical protein
MMLNVLHFSTLYSLFYPNSPEGQTDTAWEPGGKISVSYPLKMSHLTTRLFTYSSLTLSLTFLLSAEGSIFLRSK